MCSPSEDAILRASAACASHPVLAQVELAEDRRADYVIPTLQVFNTVKVRVQRPGGVANPIVVLLVADVLVAGQRLCLWAQAMHTYVSQHMIISSAYSTGRFGKPLFRRSLYTSTQ